MLMLPCGGLVAKKRSHARDSVMPTNEVWNAGGQTLSRGLDHDELFAERTQGERMGNSNPVVLSLVCLLPLFARYHAQLDSNFPAVVPRFALVLYYCTPNNHHMNLLLGENLYEKRRRNRRSWTQTSSIQARRLVLFVVSYSVILSGQSVVDQIRTVLFVTRRAAVANYLLQQTVPGGPRETVSFTSDFMDVWILVQTPPDSSRAQNRPSEQVLAHRRRTIFVL